MSTLLDRPVSRGPAAAAAPGGTRRRARLFWPLAAAALVAAWLLLPSTVRLEQDVSPVVPVDAGLMVPEFGAEGTHSLHYRHHESVTIDVPVRNGGLLPVTIDRVSLDSRPLPLMVQLDDGELPVRLGPSEETTVTLGLRFDNCRYYHERSAETWHRVVVEGSTLGREFRSEVEFAHPLAVHGQVILDCPDRTLVRGDDVRPQ